MTNTYMNLIFTLMLMLVTTVSYAQPGTQVDYLDNFGGITLNYVTQVNMKANYSGTDGFATVAISWSGTSWDITIDVGGGPGLSFTSSVTTGNNPPDFTAGDWQDTAADGTTLLGLSGTGTVDASLPVELTSFTGRAMNSENQLRWATASETDNELFVIEHSINGRSFTTIGEVNGHGTSARTHEYNFFDKTPYSGINYYRLRQIDFDGAFTFSEVIRVTNASNDDKEVISVYPNPAAVGRLQVRYFTELSGEVSVNLISISGQVITSTTHQVNSGWNGLDVETETAGLYILQVTEGKKTESLRVLLR